MGHEENPGPSDPGAPDAAEPPEPAPEPEPAPLLVGPEVAAAIERLENPKANWVYGALMLGVSLLLFVGNQAREASASRVLALVLVLAFHELGHLVAMRIFGFRDLRMFFIPFLGAAATGRKANASGTERAIVALAGPVPGFVVALLLGVAGVGRTSGFALDLISLGLVINGLNLLPIEPLDGGRVVRTALFCRFPVAEVVLRVASGVALAAFALESRLVVLGAVAVFTLIGTRSLYRTTRVAERVRRELDPPATERIPLELHEPLARIVASDEGLRATQGSAPAFAGAMVRVWQRAHERPPALGPTVALLGFQAAFVAAIVVSWRAAMDRHPDAAADFGVPAVAQVTDDFALPSDVSWRALPPSTSAKSGYTVTNYAFQRGDGQSVLQITVLVFPASDTGPARPLSELAHDMALRQRESRIAAGLTVDVMEAADDAASFGYATRLPDDDVATYELVRASLHKLYAMYLVEQHPAGATAEEVRARARAWLGSIELR